MPSLRAFIFSTTDTGGLSDYAGRKIVRHGGALPGYLSEVVLVPEEKLGVVVLINDLVPIHAAIADKILDLFMTSKERDYVGETLQAWERSKSVLARRPAAKASPSQAGSLDGTLEDLEREAIKRGLVATGGHRKNAAARLGIGLRTLYEKLKAYGID